MCAIAKNQCKYWFSKKLASLHTIKMVGDSIAWIVLALFLPQNSICGQLFTINGIAWELQTLLHEDKTWLKYLFRKWPGKDERRTTSGPNYRLAPLVVFIYLGRCLDTRLPPDTIRQPVSGWQDVGDVSWSLHWSWGRTGKLGELKGWSLVI